MRAVRTLRALRTGLTTLLAGWLLLAATPAAATIVVTSSASGRNASLPLDGSAGALTITRPTGVTPGMALVASISVRPRWTTVTVPSGWIEMTWTDQPDGGLSTQPYGSTLVTYYKIATTAEPANYTWTFANSYLEGGMALGAMLAVSGIDTASGNPIDNNGTAWSSRVNASSNDFSTNPITTVTPNTTIISTITFLSAATFGNPSGITGITEVIDVSAPPYTDPVGITMQMSTAFRAATGVAGPVSATSTGSADYGIAHLMALQPSGIDPSLSMTRSAPLSPGSTASYAMTVSNIGLASEPGPLTLIDTLPAGLSYSSASGTGWGCSAAGQTVTCTRTGALASGATAPVLTITINVAGGAAGALTNSATVSGTGGDRNTFNNTAVDTFVIPSAPYAYYTLNESTWGSITDSSGNARNASTLGSASPTGPTVSNPPGSAVPGSPGTCGAGNIPAGTTAIGIDTGIGINSLVNAGTIAFWYAGNAAWNDGNARMLFDASNDLGASDRHFYLAKGSAGNLYFSLKDSAGTASTASTAAYSFGADEWHHIAVTWNLATNSLQVFVDGALAASSSTVLNGTLGALATLYVGSQRMAGVTGTGTGYTTNTANGLVDELRLYAGVLSVYEIETFLASSQLCSYSTYLEYRFDEQQWAGTAAEVIDSSASGFNGTAAGLSATKPTTSSVSPAIPGSIGTCAYGVFNRANKDYVALPAGFGNLGATTSFTATAWVRSTDVSLTGQRILADDENGYGAQTIGYALTLGDPGSGKLRFLSRHNTTAAWLDTGAVMSNNTWYFIAASVDHASKTKRLYVYDTSGTQLSAVSVVYSQSNLGTDTGFTSIGGETNAALGAENTSSFGFSGNIDEVRIYQGVLSTAELVAVSQITRACPSYVHHLQIDQDGTGLTCTPETVVVKACANAACSSLYSGAAISGTLSWSGAASGSTAFTLAAGTSLVSVSVPVTAVGTVTLATSGVAPSTSSATTCLNTSTSSSSCALAFADTGLLFDVPDHRAEVSNTVAVTAVRKSDNAAVCIPAFASVSKSITFTCGYSNPATGTLPVRVGGAALNSGNSTAAACDGTGRAVSLAFNASGVASTQVIYADAGRMTLNASYAGSGADAGLVMTGSDTFISAPFDFAVGSITAGTQTAGSAFSATVTARNYLGTATRNFGRESAPEGVTLGFVRSHPTGTGAVNGSFGGSVGAFSSGAALASNLVWSEVGRGDISALLSSTSYLGSGISAAGSSAGSPIWCANEGGTCALPTGATAAIYYIASGTGWAKVASGLSSSVACTNAVFGDPFSGSGKACQYVVTGGAAPLAAGNTTFKPHHFDTTTSAACSTFTYAGQPFAGTLTARNASGATTVNYDGSANTNPNYAKATMLTDGAALGVGTLSGSSVAASAFATGVASAAPTYTYTSKTTTARTLVLRATDSDGVSSSGYTEGTVPLRSGRLRLSNAFGSAKASLQVPVVAEYWSGNAWVLNSADNCTTLAAGNVVLSNPVSSAGNASAAITTAGALSLASGSGTITLTAPSPVGSSLSVDIALNLGATTADQSCQPNHPASTGAAKPWLRAVNGSCAATADRDPAGRASFGIYSNESRKLVHVRDMF